MAGSVNKAIIVGHLGQDPEVSRPGELTICKFSVATNQRRKGADGEYVEAVEWHNIVCFDRLAQVCEQYLRRGSQVYVEGQIQTDRWETDGVKSNKSFIRANTVEFLGGKGGNDNDNQRRQAF